MRYIETRHDLLEPEKIHECLQGNRKSKYISDIGMEKGISLQVLSNFGRREVYRSTPYCRSSKGLVGRLRRHTGDWRICFESNYLYSTMTFTMKALKFVTGNANKVIEVNAILKGLIPVEPVALDLPEIQGTLEEIASDKCRRAAQIVWYFQLFQFTIANFQYRSKAQ